MRWQVNNECETFHSDSYSGRDCRNRLLLLWRKHHAPGTAGVDAAARRQYGVAERCLQPISVVSSGPAHAFTYLNGLFAGGLRNSATLARPRWGQCEGIRGLG